MKALVAGPRLLRPFGCTCWPAAPPRTRLALEPTPGSITYGGQPRTKLTKSPIGSAVHNDFYDQQGQRVYETYILQPNRSLKLVRRQIVPDFP